MIVNTNVIEHASNYARNAHGSQLRKYTGEPYWNHLHEVAMLLKSKGLPDFVVAAGYLHDTIEDTTTKYLDLSIVFGEAIANLVIQVTDVSRPEIGNRAVRKAVDRQYLAGASPDAQSIKLADMVSNTKDIAANDKGFARIYLPEKRALLGVLGNGRHSLYILAESTLVEAERLIEKEFSHAE